MAEITNTRMGAAAALAILLAAATGTPADIAAVRTYQSRGGISMNLEQQINDRVGFFARAGWADGSKEPYEFTDIDRTVAAGFSISGKLWGRDDDIWGIAGVDNAIIGVHQAFLNAGLDLVPQDGSRGEGRYGVGFDILLGSRITLSLAFLGREPFGRIVSPSEISVPRASGGSSPMYIFENFGLPVINVPIVNYDDNQHSPNENLRIGNFWQGMEIYGALLTDLKW